jgi:hypothetical protein
MVESATEVERVETEGVECLGVEEETETGFHTGMLHVPIPRM